MSDFDRKVANTRASIVILLEQALTTMGENFTNLGEALRNEEKDAEERAEYLQSEQGRTIWGTVWQSDVLKLRSLINLFDKIVDATANGTYKHDVQISRETYSGTEFGKLEHLIGEPADLKKYLVKAGFKVTGEVGVGAHMFIVVSRP